jgi:hypothetical protein
MIILFFEEQMEALKQERWFEIDEAYKRIEGQKNGEITIGRFVTLPQQGTAFHPSLKGVSNSIVAQVFTRIITSARGRDTFFHVFKKWFELLGNDFNMPNRWRHIDGHENDSQWLAIIMDQGVSQMMGMC